MEISGSITLRTTNKLKKKMVSPTIIGITVVTIITTIAGYFILKPKNKSIENAGEVINNLKVIIPENTEIKYILYCITAFIAVYLTIKSLRYCTKTWKKGTCTMSKMELTDLENPTFNA